MIQYAIVPATYKLVYGNGRSFSSSSLSSMDKQIQLSTGKNMYVAFQLLISSDRPWSLNVGHGLWISQDPERQAIRVQSNDPSVKMNIVDMHIDDDRLLRADALLTQDVTEQDANFTRAVYCEWLCGKGELPGEKELGIHIMEGGLFADEQSVGYVSAKITVYPFTKKDVSENKFYLDLWQHLSNIARKHEVPLWSNEHFRILEGYVASLAELGQKTITIVASEIPWSGQGCADEHRMRANLFEYSIIPLKKNKEGKLEADFLPMQRYIDLCMSYGIRDEISVYGLMNVWVGGVFGKVASEDPDNLRVRYFDETAGKWNFLRNEEDLEEYIRLIGDYFRRTNQVEIVRIAADEPADLEKYRASIRRIRKILPEFKLKAAINHPEFIQEYRNEISDFVPFITGLVSNYDLLQSYKKSMPDKRFLWYICCFPNYPNTFLCNDLCETLALGVLNSYFHMDGLLRWAYTVWNDEPRKDIRYGDFKAGDTNFVYPSFSGKPLLSLRWKTLRDAIALYELLETVREHAGDAKADDLIATVIHADHLPNFWEHSASDLMVLDASAYESLKKECLISVTGLN